MDSAVSQEDKVTPVKNKGNQMFLKQLLCPWTLVFTLYWNEPNPMAVWKEDQSENQAEIKTVCTNVRCVFI